MILTRLKSALRRPPDWIIGEIEKPYLLRWWVIPRNRFFNIYLHKFCRSDDDRALHDHPWLFNASILLKGEYIEHVPACRNCWPGDLRTRKLYRRAPGIYFRPGRAPHRVELLRGADGVEIPVWTIFITGPRIRQWGFYCASGWRHWKIFTANTKVNSQTGRGCE